LEGNVRHNPTLSGTRYNVFGIQVGVGITLGIRSAKRRAGDLYFARVDKLLPREQKLSWLLEQQSISHTEWVKLNPDAKHTWLRPKHGDEFETFLAIGNRVEEPPNAIFRAFSAGFKTNRDDVVYNFGRRALEDQMKLFSEDYNLEVDRFKRAKKGV
jgi:predicted helicase